MSTPPPKLGGSFDDTLPAGAGKKGADEDFLRLFQVPERGKGGLSMSSAPATPPASGKTREAGEFTRLFQSAPQLTPKARPRSPTRHCA